MHMSNNEMIDKIVCTFYDEVSVHCLFHCGVVPFDDQKKKKNPLLPVSEISKFSTPKLSFLSVNLILIDLKEVQRLPVRFFWNPCTTLTFQFIWLQQALLRLFSQCFRRTVEKTCLTYTVSAMSSLWSLLLHFTVVLVQQAYNQDESILNSVKNIKEGINHLCQVKRNPCHFDTYSSSKITIC